MAGFFIFLQAVKTKNVVFQKFLPSPLGLVVIPQDFVEL
jgi:hypothetical protein